MHFDIHIYIDIDMYIYIYIHVYIYIYIYTVYIETVGPHWLRLRLHPEWGSDAQRPTTAIIGVDPAFRTGCKCALISLTGPVEVTEVTALTVKWPYTWCIHGAYMVLYHAMVIFVSHVILLRVSTVEP